MTGKGQPEKVSRYLDEMMGREEKNSCRAHLERCPVCRSIFDEYRMIRAMIRDVHDKSPSDMGFRVLNRLYSRRQRVKTAVFAASMVALLGAGFFLGNNNGRALVASREEILREALEKENLKRIPVYSGTNVEDIRVRYEEVNF